MDFFRIFVLILDQLVQIFTSLSSEGYNNLVSMVEEKSDESFSNSINNYVNLKKLVDFIMKLMDVNLTETLL